MDMNERSRVRPALSDNDMLVFSSEWRPMRTLGDKEEREKAVKERLLLDTGYPLSRTKWLERKNQFFCKGDFV
jgi:hypothetical protein